jgi:hypothetical protein
LYLVVVWVFCVVWLCVAGWSCEVVVVVLCVCVAGGFCVVVVVVDWSWAIADKHTASTNSAPTTTANFFDVIFVSPFSSIVPLRDEPAGLAALSHEAQSKMRVLA